MASLAIAASLLGVGCERPCVEMCQTIDRWVEECGTNWVTEVGEEGWNNVEECYEDLEHPTRAEQRECRDTRQKYEERACY